MAQVARAFKRLSLSLLPRQARIVLLQRYPNLRKAAPTDLKLQFNDYLGEFTVNIDTRFKVERIMWTGHYEPDFLHLLDQWMQPDWVCFDVGGNVGALTLAMAQRLKGGSGKVHTFEPAPETFARLRTNVALNPSVEGNVVLVNQGVGEKPCVLRWSEEPDNEGNGDLLGTTGTEVAVTTVDRYVLDNDISRLDMMKIDVESMEYEVLLGATKAMRRFHPRLYFETMGRSKGLRERDIFLRIEKLLRGLGYELFRLDRQRRLVPTHAASFADYTIALPRPA